MGVRIKNQKKYHESTLNEIVKILEFINNMSIPDWSKDSFDDYLKRCEIIISEKYSELSHSAVTVLKIALLTTGNDNTFE